MKCPNCAHVSTTALLKCSACGEAYDRAELETLQHLEYVAHWLDQEAGELSPGVLAQLQASAAKQLEAARDALKIPARKPVSPPVVQPVAPAPPPSPQPVPALPPAPVRAPAEVARQLALTQAALTHLNGWLEAAGLGQSSARALRAELTDQAHHLRTELGDQAVTPPVTEVEVVNFALEALPPLHAFLLERRAELLRPVTTRPPAPAIEPAEAKPITPVSQPTPARPIAITPAAPPRPAPPPPKPAAPPINWAKVWERAWGLVVSGALLRGLLYLGAFMIVVSAVVLVVVYWRLFPWYLRLGFIAAVPLSFYGGGFFLRERAKIPIAGSVFTGIGALLVAVDFAAVYQIGGLAGNVNPTLYWLIASVVCAIIYLFTLWRVPSEFFAYITLIAGTNIAVAVTSGLGLSPEWRVASAAASVVGMAAGALPLRTRSGHWRYLADATRRLPQMLMPALLFLVVVLSLFGPGRPAWGQAAICALVSVGYGLMAWGFPAAVFAHLAVWSSIGALGYLLTAFVLPGEWYATAAAAIAPVYLGLSWWLERRLPSDFKLRTRYLFAINSAGVGLILIAVVAGLITLVLNWWPGVWALALAALVLTGCAPRFRQPLFVLVGSGLLIVPFSLGIGRWLVEAEVWQWGAWLTTAWAGLALVYLGVAALLRAFEKYVRWLNLWAHGLLPLALVVLLINFIFTIRTWFNGPTLISLGGLVAAYVASAILHDSGQHPALSRYVNWLPTRLSRAIFLWPIGALLVAMTALAWWGSVLRPAWLGLALAGMALIYVGTGQALARRKPEYRLPPQVYAYGLVVLGIVAALPERLALMTTLYLGVLVLGVLAYIYRRPVEVAVAALLLVWPFQISLDLARITPHGHSLAYALLVSVGYIPAGLGLDRAARKYAWPVYGVGYGLSIYALVASLLGRWGVYPLDVPWVAVMTPLVVTGLYVFSAYRFRQQAFTWAAALVFPIAFGQTITLLRVRPDYEAIAWIGLAIGYMLIERALYRMRLADWVVSFRWPLGIGAGVLCVLGLGLATPATALALVSRREIDYLPLILTPTLAAGQTILAARLYQSRWPLFAEPALIFVAVTLGFTGYGALTLTQFGIVWTALALIHLVIAIPLDRSPARYAHGLYLSGYALLFFAVVWSILDRASLLWTLGLGLVAAMGTAWLVHLNRHHTWDEVLGILFGKTFNTARAVARGAFLWLAAWPFPVWCVLLLQHLRVADSFYWLGFGGSALVLLLTAAWLKRYDRTYSWPLHGAAQFFTLAGLLISTPATLGFLFGGFARPPKDLFYLLWVSGFIGLQTVAVVFYAASARIFQRRLFAYIAAGLSFFPYTLAWIVYTSLAPARFAWVWLGLATGLLLIGWLLDRAKVRYAHGPYLAGYALGLLALAWSVPDRFVNLYTLAGVIVLALVSHLLVYTGRHHTFTDFVNFFWRTPNTVAQRAARTLFLFFAAYALPFWLMQWLAYFRVELAWRGLALALAAPVYLALGLAIRRVRAEYTWPLYSAAYALTAIGAMVSFEDNVLAMYVLALDAVVYTASAYIFRQSFWLYLSNTLVPVITLLILHHNAALTAPWVAWLFMGLAFLYFLMGQWLGRRPLTTPLRGSAQGATIGVGAYALPFYAPGYVLSAVALAIASADRFLALGVYSAGVVLYAVSAWRFRESVFLYPAAWLAAVPYYLGLTLIPALPPQWHGLGWLPLIVGYIGLGRFVFHRAPLGIRNWRAFFAALTQPAMPFYLLAYALSVSMMVISQYHPLTLSLALMAGAVIYFGSAALFRRAAWLYPGLLVTHLALMTALTIQPSDKPAYYATLPFLGLTWLVALIGNAFSRRTAVVQPQTGQPIFRIGRWALRFGNWPFVGHLVMPSWAQPFFIFTVIDIVVWQSLALYGLDTGLILAVGFAVLLGLFAMLWQDSALAYGTLALGLLAVGYRLRWAQMSWADGWAVVSGIGFGLYLLMRLIERLKARALCVWLAPLQRAAWILTGLALLVTLPTVLRTTTASATALAFSGALYLAIAYRARRYRLGYLGMGFLLVGWALALIVYDVQQPQWYALPGGLYFIGVGYLERRRGLRKLFAVGIESFGLMVLLLTSFIQSLNPEQGFPYFLLLLVEALLAVWWGAARRLKAPFFVGLGTSALNVVAQVIVLMGVYDINRFIIIFGVGVLLVTVAVFVERQRTLILAKAQEWREALETWG